MSFKHWFIPHKHNNHRPHATSHPALATILVFVLTVNTALNVFTSTNPQVLGFATSIYQQELYDLTNSERAGNGLTSLTPNSTLAEAARLKALHMFEENYWAHTSPGGVEPWHWFSVVGYEYSAAGENLARDFDTSSGVVSAWMASPSHRDNILYDDFTEIGIAVVNGNLAGEDTTLVVQLFGTPSVTPTPPPQEVIIPPTPTPTTQIAAPTSTPTPLPTLAPTRVITPTVEPTATPTVTPTPLQDPLLAFGTTINPPTTIIPDVEESNSPLTLGALIDPQNYSFSRLFTISALTLVILLFGIEIYYSWREEVLHHKKHKIAHVGILMIVLLSIITGSAGAIL